MFIVDEPGPEPWLILRAWNKISTVPLFLVHTSEFNKSSPCESLSCKLWKMQAGVLMSHRLGWFTCLVYTVVYAPSTSGCAFLYFTVHTIQSSLVQYRYFKLYLQKDNFIELLAAQHEEVTNEHLMELETQRKDEERWEEEETEEPKWFTMQDVARGLSLFKRALLAFQAQAPNGEWYMKVVAAIQNAIQCHHVIYDETKKQPLSKHHWIIFARALIALNPARNPKLCHQCQA